MSLYDTVYDSTHSSGWNIDTVTDYHSLPQVSRLFSRYPCLRRQATASMMDTSQPQQ